MLSIHPWTSGQLRHLLAWDSLRLEHISQQTGKSIERLQRLQRSAVISEQLGVPIEVLYGLDRAGLTLSLRGLAQSSQDSRNQALVTAVSSRWIPALSKNDRSRHLERLAMMLGPGVRLRVMLHQQWSRWTRRELMTAVEYTTTAMTLAVTRPAGVDC
jgi:hypothetical protein